MNMELAEEEVEMQNMTAILNAYNIYYNRRYKTSGTMLDNLDFSKSTSTNKKIDSFYKEILEYKKTEPKITQMPQKGYCLKIDGENYYCENIVPILNRLVSFENWIKIDWDIEDV